MRICQAHWDELRAAIAAAGLSKFVSNSGEQARERLQAQLQPGTPELEGFDPLMNANFGIWVNAVEQGGNYLLLGKEDGTPFCPLCELEAHTETKAAEWIEAATNEQSRRAAALGLMPGVQ